MISTPETDKKKSVLEAVNIGLKTVPEYHNTTDDILPCHVDVGSSQEHGQQEDKDKDDERQVPPIQGGRRRRLGHCSTTETR